MDARTADRPLVTVCVPTIGRTEYLGATMESLAAQTLDDVEVLVLDNASPDAAQRQLAAWAQRDRRVRLLRVEARVPMFENFNRGIAAARGKYVAFFHDDDVYRPRFLEVLVRELERYPSAAFAGCNFDFVDERGDVTERRRWIRRTELWSGRRYVEYLLQRGRNPAPMQSIVFRRAVLDGGLDPTVSIHFGDFVILMRYAEGRDVAMVADPLVAVRRHGAQASMQMSPSEAIALRTRTLQAYCDEYLGRHPDERAFVAHMKRRLRRSKRTGVLWAWLAATHPRDAEGALAQLDDGAAERALAQALRLVDRGGLGLERRPRVLHLARRIADAIGL